MTYQEALNHINNRRPGSTTTPSNFTGGNRLFDQRFTLAGQPTMLDFSSPWGIRPQTSQEQIRGGAPLTLQNTTQANLEQVDYARDFQQGVMDFIRDRQSIWDRPEVSNVLSDLQIGSPLYNRQVQALQNESNAQGRASDDIVRSSLAARGIGGSPEAALRTKAAGENFRHLTSALAELDRNILGAQTQFTGDIARTDAGQFGTQVAGLSQQEPITFDYLEPFLTQESLEQLGAGLQDLRDTREASRPGSPEWIMEQLFSALPMLITSPQLFGLR